MKTVYTLLSAILISLAVQAAPDSLAVKSYTMGGGNREFGYLALRIDANSSVLFNITANCNTAQCAHGLAGIRIDNNGNMIYNKKIGSATIDVNPNKAIYTSDKHILLLGGFQNDNRLVIKMDTLFNVIWTKEVQMKPSIYNSGSFGDGIVEMNNSYYISFANVFAKLNTDGTVVFAKNYNALAGNTNDQNTVTFFTLETLAPGKFFLPGEIVDDAPNYNGYGFMSIIDTNGNILKQKKLNVGAPYSDGITQAIKESANRIKIFGHYDNDLYAANVDTNLAVTNVIKYHGTAPLYTISACYNGKDRYFISSHDHNNQKISVLAIDNGGAVQWSKFLINGGGYFRSWNYMLNDCSFAVYSSQTVNTAIKNLGFWVKMNEDGTTGATNVEAPLTITTTNIPTATVTPTTAYATGQWQTNFATQTFLYDNTLITDSMWHTIVNPIICPTSTTGTEEIATQTPKNLCSPNPFYGTMEIAQGWELDKITNLAIYDITGRIIFSEEKPTSKAITPSIEVKGIVFVRWTYNGHLYTQKMVGL